MAKVTEQVLGDHYRVGRRLVPPLVHRFPISPVSWVSSMVPDYLWIALLLDSRGWNDAVEVARSVFRLAPDETAGSLAHCARMAAFEGCTSGEWESIRTGLGPLCAVLNESLAPLSGYCPHHPFAMTALDPCDVIDAFQALAQAECERIAAELMEKGYPVEVGDVVAGLLARQWTLALEFLARPSLATSLVGPLLLRPMADVRITLGWIIQEPIERTNLFVKHGLGQLKLEIAHMRRLGVSTELVGQMEAYLANQSLPLFTEVVLGGGWSGVDTRRMADECGLRDLYTGLYQPFSGAVHGTWGYVLRSHMARCSNPFHGAHMRPDVGIGTYSPEMLQLAISLADDSARTIVETLHLEPGECSPSEWLDLAHEYITSMEDVG